LQNSLALYESLPIHGLHLKTLRFSSIHDKFKIIDIKQIPKQNDMKICMVAGSFNLILSILKGLDKEMKIIIIIFA
jgi:hypothetical protein